MTINWQVAKNFITEKTDTVHNSMGDVFQNAKNSLSEFGANANTAIDTVKNPVVNSIQQKTSQVVDSLTTTSEQVKNSISKVSNQATHQITETTNQAANTFQQARETIKDSVGNTFKEAESLSQIAGDKVQAAINNMGQDWLQEHPIIFWLVNHPLPSLILLVIVIILMFGLFQALGSLIKDAWLLILTSPFKLFKLSLQWSFKSLFKAGNSTPISLSLQPKILSGSFVTSASASIEYEERITKIYQRLEEIHQEEHQLLAELKTIVGKG